MSGPPVKTLPIRRAPPRLSRGMGRVVAELAKKTGAMDPALIDAWPDIVGPELAKYCRPVKLTKDAKYHTLVVSVPNGAAAMRAQYAQSQILQRAAHFLRQPMLKRMKIEQRGGASTVQKAGASKRKSRFASQVFTAADLPKPAPPPPERPAKSLDEALKRLRRSVSSLPR